MGLLPTALRSQKAWTKNRIIAGAVIIIALAALAGFTTQGHTKISVERYILSWSPLNDDGSGGISAIGLQVRNDLSQMALYNATSDSGYLVTKSGAGLGAVWGYYTIKPLAGRLNPKRPVAVQAYVGEDKLARVLFTGASPEDDKVMAILLDGDLSQTTTAGGLTIAKEDINWNVSPAVLLEQRITDCLKMTIAIIVGAAMQQSDPLLTAMRASDDFFTYSIKGYGEWSATRKEIAGNCASNILTSWKGSGNAIQGGSAKGFNQSDETPPFMIYYGENPGSLMVAEVNGDQFTPTVLSENLDLAQTELLSTFGNDSFEGCLARVGGNLTVFVESSAAAGVWQSIQAAQNITGAAAAAVSEDGKIYVVYRDPASGLFTMVVMTREGDWDITYLFESEELTQCQMQVVGPGKLSILLVERGPFEDPETGELKNSDRLMNMELTITEE